MRARSLTYTAPGRLSSLARGAPVGDAVRVALAARGDRRSAARARAAGLTVDGALPEARSRASGASAARPRSSTERSSSSGDVAEPRPGRDLRAPERLGAPEVADPRDEPLVEERLADRGALVGGAHPLDHLVDVGRVGEDVGPEAADAGVVELQDRARARESPPRSRRGGRATASRAACSRRFAPGPASGPSCAGGCAARARPRSGGAGSCRPPRHRAGGGRRGGSATPVTRARGCGVSTSSCSPTRVWSRWATRWIESPSGIECKRMHPRLRAAAAGVGRGARLERARAGRSAALPERLLGRGRAREGVHARAGLAAARARDPCPERRDLRARVPRDRAPRRPGTGAGWRSSSRSPST